MTNELATFRAALLQAVRSAREARPDAHIHLVYSPELFDPLDLVGDARRDMGLIHAPDHLASVSADRDQSPRLLTLDCRRVASYLLESDAALDDPAFEQSITQSHAEICLAQAYNAELGNDEREFSEYAIGGWLISTESAKALAARLRSFSSQGRTWVRWTNHAILSTVWPSMTAEQRHAMLGDAAWLSFDAGAVLCQYAATVPAVAAPDVPGTVLTFAPRLDAQQLSRIANVPLVRDLLAAWKSMCETEGVALPRNAEIDLHAHVTRAQQAGLDAESVAIYTMTLVQLKQGACDDGEWRALVSHAAHEGLALRDLLDTLSDPFWTRYSMPEHASKSG